MRCEDFSAELYASELVLYGSGEERRDLLEMFLHCDTCSDCLDRFGNVCVQEYGLFSEEAGLMQNALRMLNDGLGDLAA